MRFGFSFQRPSPLTSLWNGSSSRSTKPAASSGTCTAERHISPLSLHHQHLPCPRINKIAAFHAYSHIQILTLKLYRSYRFLKHSARFLLVAVISRMLFRPPKTKSPQRHSLRAAELCTGSINYLVSVVVVVLVCFLSIMGAPVVVVVLVCCLSIMGVPVVVVVFRTTTLVAVMRSPSRV